MWSTLKRPLIIACAIAIGTSMGFYGYKNFSKLQKQERTSFVERLVSHPPYKQVLDIPASEDEKKQALAILQQPFFALGEGRQSIAFGSADGKYVLKFPKQPKISFRESLPDMFQKRKAREMRALEKKENMDIITKSFLIAKTLMPEETGIVFLHLNTTQDTYGTIRLLDKDGNLSDIDLDAVQFVIQKRAALLKPTFINLMYHKKVEEAEKLIDSIFQLFVTCARQGVLDTDGALITNDNLGILGDHPIYIDTGKLRMLNKPATKSSFTEGLRHIKPLRCWLEQYYPELVDHFDKARMNAINQFE